MLDLLIYLFSGPFSHCILLFDTQTSASHTTINKECNTVLYGRRDFTKQRPGYTYIKISVTIVEYQKITSIIKAITSHPTEFAASECFGLSSYNRPVTSEKQAWFCSSLISFLLRETGILHREIDVTKISVTTLYLLIRQSASKTRTIEQLQFHPITNQPIPTSDDTYTAFMNIDKIDIPILDIQNFKGR
mgnify:FL=1